MKSAWQLAKATYEEWSAANVSRLAAALAYFTVFSITPVLVIAIGIAGAIFGAQAAQSGVSTQIRDLLGPAAAETVMLTLHSAAQSQKGGIIATVVGVALLAYGATGVFQALQDSLNTIWGVKPRPDVSFWEMIRVRLLSFGMVIATGFVLLVSLLVSAALSALTSYLSAGTSAETAWRVLHLVVSVLVFGLMFSLIFHVLPDVQLRWHDVWIGGVLTAILFSAGKSLIGVYLSHTAAASAYGAASSLVLLLLWVYYSSQILFLGAAFTKVYAQSRRKRIAPEAHAVPVTAEARAREGIPHPDVVRRAAQARPLKS